MPNIVGKFANIIVFILIYTMSYTIFLIFATLPFDAIVTDKTAQFVNECQVTGQIDPQNMSAYLDTIYTLGYEVEITHSSLRSYPDDAGGYFNDYYDNILNEILTQMYGSGTEQIYTMKYGDELTIRVIRQNTTTTALLSALFNWNIKGTEVTRYSGTIGNSRN